MSQLNIETWLHASDEEREDIHSTWDVNNGEGKEVAEEVANLLEKECVYDIHNVGITESNGQWQIQAYAGDDYESLKDRGIIFLGFKLNIIKATT